MAKIIINLPGGLKVEREVKPPEAKPSSALTPKFAPAPEEKAPQAPEKSLLKKAAEAVEEVVKPKRRGRPAKKKTDADQA